MRALGLLKLWQKLSLIALALLVPALLATAFYIRTVSGLIDVTREEIAGARFLQPLGALNIELIQQRSARDPGSNAPIAALGEEVDRANVELAGRFETAADWQKAKADWTR